MKRRKSHETTFSVAVLAITSWFVAMAEVVAERVVVYPTSPGSNMRDWTQPGVVYEDNGSGRVHVYPTCPGSNYRDLSQPGYVIEKTGSGRTTIYPTLPGSRLRDRSSPGYVVEEERDYLELPSLELPELPDW